jgi:hypothetical protein
MGKVKKANAIVTIVLASVLFINSVRAEDTTFVQRFDLFAEKLSRQEMKTSILYNRVFPIAKLNKQIFTEEERAEITNDYQYWKQIYLEMYNADYDQKQKLNFDAQLSKVKEYVSTHRKLPIGIIHFKYECIDTNAIHDGRIRVENGKLISIAKQKHSPYLLNQVSNLAILAEQLHASEQTLVFDPDFIYTNTKEKIRNIRIQFNSDNKNTYTLAPGDTLRYTFDKIGKQSFSYQLVFDNSDSISSQSYFTVMSSGTAPCEFKQGITTETFLGENILAGCTYEFGLYYSNCINSNSEVLRKPILVLDGFDPSDSRKVGNIYDLMNTSPVQLADYLRAEGHDLIICNFPNGADYIERNALGVIQLIEYIKARTTDKIIVIGPSMGGLIAKYALAKMEKENKEHNVGLYVSFDAPHQGANVPIGAQYFLHFFGQIIGDAGAQVGLNKIKSPAAREMIIHYYSRNNVFPEYNDLRSTYLINSKNNSMIGSKGYPIKTRNIALINGSETKVKQGISGLLFSLNIGLFGNHVNAARASVYTSPSNGTALSVDLRAVNPNNFFQIEQFIRYASVIPNNPYPCSLDDASGGRYDTQYQLTHEDGIIREGFTLYHAEHNFIPSTSALDISYPDGHVNYLFGIREAKILCNNLTPFVAYFAPAQNEDHVTITPENANWIKRELRNGNRTVYATSENNTIGAGKIFNYGSKTKDFYFDSFEVKDGGYLGINANVNTGYNNEAKPTRFSHFKVDGYNVKCDPILIKISNAGKLQIGHWGYTTGELRISENTVLHLDDFSEVEIFDNSTLIIEKGSKLIIGKNTNINLFENNSSIIIEGTLEIEEDAIFSFTGEGHVYLKTKDIVFGRNAKMIFHGKSNDDLVLKVESGTYLAFPYAPNSKNLLEIKNARVDFLGDNCFINSAVATNLINCTFNTGNGIYLNGQANIQIQNCSFNNTKYGITSFTNNIQAFNTAAVPLRLESCTFNNNEIAIRIFGKGFDLQNIYANNCKKVITAESIDTYSQLLNSSFITNNQTGLASNNAAISINALLAVNIYIANANITNYNVGVYVSKAILNLKCTEILNANNTNLWIANAGVLNMSPLYYENSGYNTLSVRAGLNNRNVCLEYASNVNIAGGANKFKIDADQNIQFISGTMLNIPNSINFRGNNWYARINANNYLTLPAQKYFYIASNNSPSAPRIQNFILTPILGSNMFGGCVLSGQGMGLPLIDSIKQEEMNSNTLNKIKEQNMNMESTVNEEITLMPNPTKGIFEVVLNNENSKIHSVSVFNMQGKLIREISAAHSSHSVKIDIEGFYSGVYLVNIKTPEREYIKKIVLIK